MHFPYKTLTKKFHLCISNKFVFELQIKFIIQLFEQKNFSIKGKKSHDRAILNNLNFISIQTSSIRFVKVLFRNIESYFIKRLILGNTMSLNEFLFHNCKMILSFKSFSYVFNLENLIVCVSIYVLVVSAYF